MSAIVSSLPGTLRLVEGEARHFGGFELLAKLGQGGMADVFLAARKSKPSELLVVKRLKHDYVDDAEHRALFGDEARVAPLLKHPNVVRTWDSGEVEGHPYMALEYLDGQPLDRVLSAVHGLGVSAAVHVVCEILEGLHYVHELCSPEGRPLEIVHRDVSPHNVFLTYEGRVTLVDFGIAKSKARARQTATGVVRGKIYYMAPEQALCDEVDRRADVFAVAVVLWELLTGDKLWGDASDVQILKRMTFGEVPSIRERLPELPSALCEVVERALAPKPDERYATAREFREALRDAVDSPFRRVELGAAVSAAASELRQAMRETIEAHLARAYGTDAPASLPEAEVESVASSALDGVGVAPGESEHAGPASPGPATLEPSSESASPAGLVSAVEATLAEPSRSPPVEAATAAVRATPAGLELAAPRERRSRSGVGALLGLGVALFAGVLALRALSESGESGTGASESADTSNPRPGAQSSSAPLASTSAASPAAEQVELRIDVAPETATATLDGMRIDTPFSARFPRDRGARPLRVEAPGYEARSTLVVFDRDQRLRIELSPLSSAAPSAKPPPISLPSSLKSARPRASSAPTNAPTSPIVDDRDPWAPKPR